MSIFRKVIYLLVSTSDHDQSGEIITSWSLRHINHSCSVIRCTIFTRIWLFSLMEKIDAKLGVCLVSEYFGETGFEKFRFSHSYLLLVITGSFCSKSRKRHPCDWRIWNFLWQAHLNDTLDLPFSTCFQLSKCFYLFNLKIADPSVKQPSRKRKRSISSGVQAPKQFRLVLDDKGGKIWNNCIFLFLILFWE